MYKLYSIILLLFTLAAPTANAQPTWSPLLTTGDALFPSLILATRNLDIDTILKAPPRVDYLGDPMGAFGIKLHTDNTDTKLRVSITIDGLTETSNFEATLPKAGHEYTVMPYIRYKANTLARIKQPYPATAIFSVSINGTPAEEITRKISVRTINDVPYAIGENGKYTNTSFLYAAYVNENAPVIDEILQDALAHNAVDMFDGYTDDAQKTYRQIFAIWNALQRKGIKFSSITNPSGYSKNIYSQHVRLPDEAFNNSQANCVDGSVLLASALYKIGMCPVLILKPSHMFLGVYTDKNSCEKRNLQNITFIETTEVGNIAPLNIIQKKWKFQTDNGYLASTSYNSMMQAIENARQTFSAMAPALQAKQQGYSILDVSQLRELGIMPISSFNEQSNY